MRESSACSTCSDNSAGGFWDRFKRCPSLALIARSSSTAHRSGRGSGSASPAPCSGSACSFEQRAPLLIIPKVGGSVGQLVELLDSAPGSCRCQACPRSAVIRPRGTPAALWFRRVNDMVPDELTQLVVAGKGEATAGLLWGFYFRAGAAVIDGAVVGVGLVPLVRRNGEAPATDVPEREVGGL